MAMQTFFSTDDWHVEEAPITGWGYNQKGTFFLSIKRNFGNGPKDWTLNIPKNKLGQLPQQLDAVPKEKRKLLCVTGGWVNGNCEATIGLKIAEADAA